MDILFHLVAVGSSDVIPIWSEIQDYKIGICCFSLKHASLRSKSSQSGYYVRMKRHVDSCFSVF
jgi:hypothetical protein